MATSFFLLPPPLLLLLLLCLAQRGRACFCPPKHPQETFCQADVVLRAKVGDMKADVKGVDPVKYDIQHLSTLKGRQNRFDAIYTVPSSASCGVTLIKDVEYLFMGQVNRDGMLEISLCDFFQPWAAMSDEQKNLLLRYHMGCHCKIKPCRVLPCDAVSPRECWWMVSQGEQAREYACVKRSDGTCTWYRGPAFPVESLRNPDDD
ncbi:metalloproteinase inhibitor 2-like [Stigmatopora nigra]